MLGDSEMEVVIPAIVVGANAARLTDAECFLLHWSSYAH